jgi:hypothetical protein
MGAAFMRWTGESMGNGAYYVGAAIFFLFCLAFFVVGGATRQWIIASSIFFVFMSWGSNFNAFNTFLFNYLPLYNKFRVPSMALTIVFFIVPFYGILGLNQWYTLDKKARFDALKKGALAFTGFVALFGLIAPFVMDLETARDAQFAQQGFRIDQLVGDRRSLATSSALASLGFGLLTAAALYFFHIGKLKLLSSAALIGGIALLDLGLFTTDQIEREDFLSQRQWEAQYAPTAANQAINQDSDPHFRVWNATVGLTNDSYTSYHHKSVGGYHGAKLQRYQDLIDNQLNNQNIACFSMLNAKYIITQGGQNGQPQAQRNPDACGNAWSVQNIQLVPNADAEMAALTSFNPKSTAIIDTRYSDYLGGKTNYAPAKARLTSYDPKHLEYSVEGGDAFIVFSELFYEGAGNDWQAYLDGVPVAHIRVNYLLRGLTVPAGKHEVVFEYAPKSHYTGQKINYAGSGIILLLLFWMGFKQVRERTNG